MGFICDDFLLGSEAAKRLYGLYAKDLPVFDYHCHINPKDIAEDRKFKNITEIWLGGDHYKWRLMRSAGIPEENITGDADDFTKFRSFAEVLPKAVCGPMYDWCHLELKRYFGYDGLLCEKTAEEVWNICNERLKSDSMSAKNIIRHSNVKLIGTTDDPCDSLEYHKIIASDKNFGTKVIPSFRPDKAVAIRKKGFSEYIFKLSEISGTVIDSFASLKKVLEKRLLYFISFGCVASDHGLDSLFFRPCTEEEADRIFKSALSGAEISKEDGEKYSTALLIYLAGLYNEKNIVMQIHYGVFRNPNSKLFSVLGPDSGFDSMRTEDSCNALVSMLDYFYSADILPKTVIYSLNPADDDMICSVMGAYQNSKTPGRIQHGAAWWFNDTKRGIRHQLESLADLSLLGNFIGMLTDSRSLLSYTRHEYFRRILCGMLGEYIEKGEMPDDYELEANLVKDICYYNAERFFGVKQI